MLAWWYSYVPLSLFFLYVTLQHTTHYSYSPYPHLFFLSPEQPLFIVVRCLPHVLLYLTSRCILRMLYDMCFFVGHDSVACQRYSQRFWNHHTDRRYCITSSLSHIVVCCCIYMNADLILVWISMIWTHPWTYPSLPTESKEKKPDTGIVAKVGPGRQAGNGNYLVPQVSTS